VSNKSLLLIVSVLALTALACTLSVDLPGNNLRVSETVIEEINIQSPVVSGEKTRLTLQFGAGELEVNPGSGEALVSGSATYNVRELQPEVSVSGNKVTLSTGDLEFKGIPNFRDEYKNQWDLMLGNRPVDLVINAGAYQGRVELGGLSIASLRVTDGAADVRLGFSKPNLVEMSSLRYDTGASSVELYGLGYANFEEMAFKGGAGNYVLDFSGELSQNATVTIDAGLSSISVIVPKGISARVLVDRGLANVDISGDWEKSGDDYTLEGSGPRLTINVNLGAGNLELSNR